MPRTYATLDPAGTVPIAQIPSSISAPASPPTPHPDLAEHDALGLATDAELTTHAGTPHGTQPHAISGVSHSGTLDHSALANQTPNQHHNQAHAIGGADHTGSLTPAQVGAAPASHSHVESDVTSLVADLAAKAPSVHTHSYEPAGAVSTHAGLADPHPGYLTPTEGNAAYAALVHAHNPVHTVLADGTTAMGFGVNTSVRVTPTANATYTTTVPVAGSTRVLLILTSGTTSRTITFGTGFKTTGTLATGTVTARIFAVSFLSDGTNLYETARTVAMVA